MIMLPFHGQNTVALKLHGHFLPHSSQMQQLTGGFVSKIDYGEPQEDAAGCCCENYGALYVGTTSKGTNFFTFILKRVGAIFTKKQ